MLVWQNLIPKDSGKKYIGTKNKTKTFFTTKLKMEKCVSTKKILDNSESICKGSILYISFNFADDQSLQCLHDFISIFCLPQRYYQW